MAKPDGLTPYLFTVNYSKVDPTFSTYYELNGNDFMNWVSKMQCLELSTIDDIDGVNPFPLFGIEYY